MKDRKAIVKLIFASGARIWEFWNAKKEASRPQDFLSKSVEKMCLRVGRHETLPAISLESLENL